MCLRSTRLCDTLSTALRDAILTPSIETDCGASPSPEIVTDRSVFIAFSASGEGWHQDGFAGGQVATVVTGMLARDAVMNTAGLAGGAWGAFRGRAAASREPSAEPDRKSPARADWMNEGDCSWRGFGLRSSTRVEEGVFRSFYRSAVFGLRSLREKEGVDMRFCNTR